ncbi:MAG TPA: VWA domain-containing protein [Solirubrobacteraceae bacterium]|nr:VWA domain-containing protein [Solirubrobacteraceae bacterium]
MSFAAPPVLLGLIAVAGLVVFHVARQRRRGGVAVTFATPAMVASVAPRRPGWRRHIPIAALAVALAVLVAAAARPTITVSEPVGNLSILLATDISGSMQATDIAPNRITAAQHAANAFVIGAPRSVSIGVMEFDQTPTVLSLPTTDRLRTFAALGQLRISGGTATGNAVVEGVAVLDRNRVGLPGKQAPAAMIVLSDGKSDTGVDPVAAARQAKRANIPVYTVALGTPTGTIDVRRRNGTTAVVPAPVDPSTLDAIAKASGGQAFNATNAAGLSVIYQDLGKRLAHHDVPRQVTADFVGAGLALLLLGSTLSLTMFGRLI